MRTPGPATILLSIVLLLGATQAHADAWPSRPIRIILGFSAGGSTDAVARVYAQKMADVLKTPVIVDNKPGAAQAVAIKAVTTSSPDGYTLYFGSGSAFSQGPGVRKDLPYDPLKDLTLIGLVATAPGVVVVAPGLPVRTLAELVAYSKAHPAELNYGSSGVGSASHLQTEYLIHVTGLKITHIPFKADADIFREIYGGNVHLGMAPAQGAMGALATGRVRAIAVTGSKRLGALPKVPAMSETGLKGLDGIQPYTYYGIAGPRGLPAEIVTRVNAAINAVSATPEVAKLLVATQYVEPATGTPDGFRTFIENDTIKWHNFAGDVKLTD